MVYNLTHSMSRIRRTLPANQAVFPPAIPPAMTWRATGEVSERQTHQVHIGGDKQRTPLAGY
jgi:hypothetical protein